MPNSRQNGMSNLFFVVGSASTTTRLLVAALLVVVLASSDSDGATLIRAAGPGSASNAPRVLRLVGAGGDGKPSFVSAVGRPVYRLVSTNVKQAGVDGRQSPVVYVSHASVAGGGPSLSVPAVGRVYQQQQPTVDVGPLYQPAVGVALSTPHQPQPFYRVVQVYRPPPPPPSVTAPPYAPPSIPPAAPVQPAPLPPASYPQGPPAVAPPPPTPNEYPAPPPPQQPPVSYPPAPAPPPYSLPPTHQPPLPPPAPAAAAAASQSVQVPVYVEATPADAMPLLPAAGPDADHEGPRGAVDGSPDAAAAAGGDEKDEQCPQLYGDPCKYYPPGLYAHPKTPTCFLQCDHFGKAHVQPCAPGTEWKTDPPKDYHYKPQPSLFNKCGL